MARRPFRIRHSNKTSEPRGLSARRAVRTSWSAVLILLMPPVAAAAEPLADQLRHVAHKIVYETWQGNNWELFVASADGSQVVNLTNTPKINELYPHASPDGTKICFVRDEGEGAAKSRSVCYMNVDGTGRTVVAVNARQPCWKWDSTAIAYLQGEGEQFSYRDYATKGIFIYDLASGRCTEHPNKKIHHLYNPCWSAGGQWFVATLHAGMGYRHAILAIAAHGSQVFDLKIPGCRPDISPDGRKIAWGPSDWALRAGELDLAGPRPRVSNARDLVTSPKPMKVYHVDWSPDGKYVTYSRGPAKKRLGLAPEIVGVKAEGWDIYVADPTKVNRFVRITADGRCNKEPDWIPVRESP